MEDWLRYTGSIQFDRVVVQTEPFPEQVYNEISDGMETTAEKMETDHFLENYIQGILNCFEEKPDFVIGGFSQIPCHKYLSVIIQILAANGVKRIFVGPKGIITRPVISYLAHKNRMYGILLHNSCSPSNSFALQLIDIKGGPVSPKDRITVYGHCQNITEYYTTATQHYDFNRKGHYMVKVGDNETSISILPFQSTVDSYIKLLKDFFDFEKINDLLSGLSFYRPFRICIDCHNGAIGPYAKALFEDELGAAKGSVINYEPNGKNNPLDFTRTEEQKFQTTMAMSTNDFGAILESDGGRCLVYGRRRFLVPAGDSLAIIADSYHCIPYFQLYKFNGVGRTFYTSRSADYVMSQEQLSVIECPDGWYFFNELLFKNAVLFCGDDYGMVSKHVKDRDALWTVLAWLSVIAHKSKPLTNIVQEFWETYGRNFRTVHEFHDLSWENTTNIIDSLQSKIDDPEFVSTVIQAAPYKFTVEKAGTFDYASEGMGEATKNLGLYINLKPSARIVYRRVCIGLGFKFQIIVEVTLQSDQLPYYADRFAVTEPIAKTAAKLAHMNKFIKKKLPDRVY